LHVEDQRGIGRDHAAGAAGAVAELRRDLQLALAADLHAFHTFVPALDDLSGAERELERLAAVHRAIERLLGVGKPAGVVHLHLLAFGRDGAVTDLDVPVLHARRRALRFAGHLRRTGVGGLPQHRGGGKQYQQQREKLHELSSKQSFAEPGWKTWYSVLTQSIFSPAA